MQKLGLTTASVVMSQASLAGHFLAAMALCNPVNGCEVGRERVHTRRGRAVAHTLLAG